MTVYSSGTPKCTTYKASEAFDRLYNPVKATTNNLECAMVEASTDKCIGIAQNKPLATGDPCAVASVGEKALFISDGTTASGDSVKLSGDSGDFYKLKTFTISADTTGTPVQRIGIVTQGADDLGIGEALLTLDYIISD